jgi:predicted PurR-regulated permease PerM
MKALQKPLTWLLTFLNVGVYNLSDTIDSLVQDLLLNGLKNQAEAIISISQSIAHQQGIIIMLDTFKCLFMLISLVFFFVTNQAIICNFLKWLQSKFKQFYSFLKQKIKTKS